MTGTYFLQTSRSAFNQNQISPVCLLCCAEDETTEHFLLCCAALEIVRQPALAEILEIYGQHLGEPVHSDILVQLILDGGSVLNGTDVEYVDVRQRIERQTRRLCQSLHIERYKRLAIIPKRVRNKCKGKKVNRGTIQRE